MAAIGAGGRFKFEIDGLSAATSVARFEGDEAICRLYEFHLQLTSDDKDIAFADVIGKKAVLTLEADDLEARYVHGIVSRFEQGEEGKKFSAYHVTLVPTAWRLQHRHDTRIFQELKVPDIIEKVLKGAGVTDYRLFVSGDHPVREYCVQYRESDWAFVSRLMEEEGIFYFFEHSHDKHVLVMGDGPDAHNPIVAPDTIVFRPPLGAMAHGESVSRFTYAEEVRPGKVSLADYNFKKPKLSLASNAHAKDDADLEVYDYPGEYDLPGDGDALAKTRLEEWQAVRKVGEGETGVMRFTPGFLVTLSEHPRDACNRQHLLTRVHHRGTQPLMGEAAGADGQSYSNRFQVIPADVPFRPARVTPRPSVKGVQSAVVVGPGGDEIYTDEHGRVKVQFHWDRLGKNDEKSSCWMRVSQLWAGAGWGAMYIPRIGQEVLVDFIDGDPDRPIVTGRVYHAANVPPYPLPAEKTKSTIKSNSSPGGEGSNEFRFEDKKGSEEIYLHGQKDWNIKIEHDKGQLVGHDEALEVGHDRTKEVKHDQKETIGHDKTIKVGNDHSETIGKNESLTIASNSERTVGQNQTESIGVASALNVGAAYSVTVGAALALQVGAVKSEVVGGASSEAIGGSKSLTVGGAYEMSVAKQMSVNVSKDQTETVDGEKTIAVGKKYVLKVGDGSVTIEKNGNITVAGKDITIKGDGKINVQASSKVIIKSDGPIDIEASGAVKIKGSAVNLN